MGSFLEASTSPDEEDCLMKTLVLGGNGHIGSNLVRVLLDAGREVRVMVRPNSGTRALKGLDVECVTGNVLDRDSLRRAYVGCNRLYHLATPSAMDHNVIVIAVEGTRNVFKTMAEFPAIEKAVYTSSTLTIGYSPRQDLLLDESVTQRMTGTANQVAKWEAETWLRDYLEQSGLPVVIVNPDTTVGAHDYRPTPTNRVIVEFINKGGSPIYFDSGLGIVDVQDVARGHYLAEIKGRPGERYILGGDCVSIREQFQTLADITGLRPPRIYIPRLGMFAVAAGLQTLAKLTGGHPLLSLKLARVFVGKYGYHSSRKASVELGYTWRSHKEALRNAVMWLLQTGLVSDTKRRQIENKMEGRVPADKP